MFSRVDIGDLENLGNFLPSWISEPLGEKLYMIDEVNQLPSLPPKESPYETILPTIRKILR